MKHVYFVLCISLLSSYLLFAQTQDRKIPNDPAAQSILDQVSTKYNSYTSMKVDFSLLVDTPEEEAYTRSKGVVYMKNDKYKIDTEEMMIICDNVKRYVFIKKPPELQINYFEPEGEEIESPSELFEIYKKDFFYKVSGEVTMDNKKLTAITLVPADSKTSPYKSVKLYVDKATNQIVRGEIYSKDGVTYTYVISSVEPNIPLNDSEFTFDPSRYPGIYIDDMTK